MKLLLLGLVCASALRVEKGMEKGIDAVYDEILEEIEAGRKHAVKDFQTVAQDYKNEASECDNTVKNLKTTVGELQGDIDTDSSTLSDLGTEMASNHATITLETGNRNAANEAASKAAQTLAETDQACAKDHQGHRSIEKTFSNAIRYYKESRNAMSTDDQSTDKSDESKRHKSSEAGDAVLTMLEGLSDDARDAYEKSITGCNENRNQHTTERTNQENAARKAQNEVNLQQADLENNRAQFNEVDKRNRENKALAAEKQDELMNTLKDCSDAMKTMNFEYTEARSISNQANAMKHMVQNMKDRAGFIQLSQSEDPMIAVVARMLNKFPKDQALVQTAPVGVDRKNPFVNIIKIINTKIDEVRDKNEKDMEEHAACQAATKEHSNSRDNHELARDSAEKKMHTAYGNFFKARVDLHSLELQHARTMENLERAKYFRMMHNMENESLYITAKQTQKSMIDLLKIVQDATLKNAVQGIRDNMETITADIIKADKAEDKKYGSKFTHFKADVKALQTDYEDTKSRFTDNEKDTSTHFTETWKNAAAVDMDATQWTKDGAVYEKCEAIKTTFEERETARQAEIDALKAALKAMQNTF